MGDRANVGIRTSRGDIVFIYLHWGGDEANETVAKAISHAMVRDNDESYFTRIFISRVIDTDWDKETGVGISINEISGGGGYDIPIYDYLTKTVGMYKEVTDRARIHAGEVVDDTKIEYPRDMYLAKFGIREGESST